MLVGHPGPAAVQAPVCRVFLKERLEHHPTKQGQPPDKVAPYKKVLERLETGSTEPARSENARATRMQKQPPVHGHNYLAC
jgi:hypothetical protein